MNLYRRRKYRRCGDENIHQIIDEPRNDHENIHYFGYASYSSKYSIVLHLKETKVFMIFDAWNPSEEYKALLQLL